MTDQNNFSLNNIIPSEPAGDLQPIDLELDEEVADQEKEPTLLESPESDYEKLLRKWQRREAKLKIWFVLIVVVVTAYVAGLNLWLICNVKVMPFNLELQGNFISNPEIKYEVSMEWETLPGKELTARPVFSVGNATIPANGGVSPKPQLAYGKSLEIRVLFPDDVSPGEHNGNLVLNRMGDDDDYAEAFLLPVGVEVAGSLWDNWWVLRTWLMCLGAIYLFYYLLCLFMIDAPLGWLMFSRSGGGPAKVVKLGPSKKSWLFPHTRNQVDFGEIIRKALGFDPFTNSQASLVFLDRDEPYLETFGTFKCLYYKVIDENMPMRYDTGGPGLMAVSEFQQILPSFQFIINHNNLSCCFRYFDSGSLIT